MQEIVKHQNTSIDRPRDGFSIVAQGNARGIAPNTVRLRHVKGDWPVGIGDTERILPDGSKILVDPYTLFMGFVEWEGGQPVDSIVVRVADLESFKQLPQVRDLPNRDKSQWPLGPDGQPKDPWSPDVRFLATGLDKPYEGYTVTGSSWGMWNAAIKLCEEFDRDRDNHPGQLPIVQLGSFKKAAQDRRIGKIDKPSLTVIGWASLDDVMNGGTEPKKRPKQIEASAPKPASRHSKKASKQSIEAQIAALEAQLDEEGEDEALFDEEAE
jgi:hypothetical protein